MARLQVREVPTNPGRYEYVQTDDQGNVRESFSWYETPDAAIDAYFSPYAWPGGSPIAYYANGSVICAACAKQDFLDSDDGECWEGFSTEGDPSSVGTMCDGCNEWIVEPVCVECCNELTTVRAPLFRDDANDMIVCTPCMAKLVVKGEATKVGKRSYAIDRKAAWYAHSNPFTA